MRRGLKIAAKMYAIIMSACSLSVGALYILEPYSGPELPSDWLLTFYLGVALFALLGSFSATCAALPTRDELLSREIDLRRVAEKKIKAYEETIIPRLEILEQQLGKDVVLKCMLA